MGVDMQTFDGHFHTMSLALSHEQDERAELHQLIATLAFSRKNVILSSGRKSSFYFNMKPLVMHPRATYFVAQALCQHLEPFTPDYVGGLELGAVPLAALVAYHSQAYHRREMRGFFVRKNPKEHGLELTIEGLEKGQSLKGKKVALLDDVTTSGASVLKAAQVVQEQGGRVIGVFAIVDREEGAREAIQKQGFGFHPLYTASEFTPQSAPTSRL